MAMSSAFGLGTHNEEAIKCEFFQSNHVTSSLPDNVQSIIGGVNTSTDVKFSMSSPTIPMAVIKRESPPPTVLGNQTQEIDIKASLGATTSPRSFPSYQNFGDYEGSLESSSYSSSSDRSDSQERELKHSPNSSLPSILQDFQSPSSSSNSQPRRKARPKSMIVSSTSMSSPSLLSPSISMQPYISPFHNDSMSAPISSSTGMVSQPRHDRRRSSSGSYYGAFSSSAFASPISHSSYTYNSDQVHNQHQYERCYQDDQKQQQKQEQRSQIQYHPQQQHFQHLLDPSMVPEITDIHVCPVCQRRFTRPFNLRSHIMTHTTARPFPCDECHWKFTRQHDLLRHKRAKHPGSVPPPTPKTPKTPKVNSVFPAQGPLNGGELPTVYQSSLSYDIHKYNRHKEAPYNGAINEDVYFRTFPSARSMADATHNESHIRRGSDDSGSSTSVNDRIVHHYHSDDNDSGSDSSDNKQDTGAGDDVFNNGEDSSPSRFLYLLITCLAIGGFLFGYDTGVVAGALLPIKDEFGLTSQEQEFVVGGTTLGAIIGGLLAGALSDLVGRKPVTLLSSVIFVVGAALMTFAHKYWFLLLGRVVVGVGVGLAALVVPLYIGELAPSAYRGRLVTINVLLITGGQLIAYLVSSALTDVTNGWRWMMAISAIPALFQLITLPFLPESPRYLVKKGDIAGAETVLRRCMGLSKANDNYIAREVESIKESLEMSHKTRYRDLLRKDLRRPLIIACFMQLWQQLSGFNTAMYYSATILKMAGFPNAKSATLFSLLIAATNMIMTIGFTVRQDECVQYGDNCAACLTDDRCFFADLSNTCQAMEWDGTGNRPIYNGACPNRSDGIKAGSWVALASLVFYVASYGLGLGNAPWLIQSELFPLDIRGKATGMATACNFAGNLIISLTFLTLTQRITATGTFWLYAVILVFAWLFVYFLVPETAGLDLEAIQELFRNETATKPISFSM
ncbi:myo-inositol transporter, partial [Entomortierella chlamydospora]